MKDLRRERIRSEPLLSWSRLKARLSEPQVYEADSIDDILAHRDAGTLRGTPGYAFLGKALHNEGMAYVMLDQAGYRRTRVVDATALRLEAKAKKLPLQNDLRSLMRLEQSASPYAYLLDEIQAEIDEIDMRLARSLENAVLYSGDAILPVHTAFELGQKGDLQNIVLKYNPKTRLFIMTECIKDRTQYVPTRVVSVTI